MPRLSLSPSLSLSISISLSYVSLCLYVSLSLPISLSLPLSLPLSMSLSLSPSMSFSLSLSDYLADPLFLRDSHLCISRALGLSHPLSLLTLSLSLCLICSSVFVSRLTGDLEQIKPLRAPHPSALFLPISIFFSL